MRPLFETCGERNHCPSSEIPGIGPVRPTMPGILSVEYMSLAAVAGD
jgi:hypothetical protein